VTIENQCEVMLITKLFKSIGILEQYREKNLKQNSVCSLKGLRQDESVIF